MTESKLKEMLYLYPSIPQEIILKNQEIADIIKLKVEYGATMTPGGALGMPRSTTISDPTYKSVELLYEKYEKHIQRLIAEISQMLDAKEQIDKMLNWLRGQSMSARKLEYELIVLKYFEKAPNQTICNKLCYERTGLHRFHDRVMAQIIKWWNT